MKKNFKRNKILLASLIGLAVVASASVAFSTWIFGLNKESETVNGIKVEVDSYKDTTKYIDIAVATGETIRLAEYRAIDSSADKIASTKDIVGETGKADFDINLSKFEFAYSTDQFNFDNITFTMVVYNEGATETDINKVSETEVHSTVGTNTVVMRPTGTYEYISLATATIDSTNLKTWFGDGETIGSYQYYTVKEDMKKISLKWSEYFGKDASASPAAFYNTKYKAEYVDDSSKTIKDKLQFLNTANSEMKAMQKVFEDTANIKIKISAKLNVTEKPVVGA